MGVNLRIAIVKANKNQIELANEVGISKQYLSRLVNSHSCNPSNEIMTKIAKILKSDVQTLFFSEEN